MYRSRFDSLIKEGWSETRDTAAQQAYKCIALPGSAKVKEVQLSLFNLSLFLPLNLTASEDNIVVTHLKPLYYNWHLAPDRVVSILMTDLYWNNFHVRYISGRKWVMSRSRWEEHDVLSLFFFFFFFVPCCSTFSSCYNYSEQNSKYTRGSINILWP